MFASLELRMRLVGDLGIAIFNDWGMAWKNPGDVSGRLPPQPSVGAGLRYATPIGPIRLDFGWRIPLGEIPKTPRHETYRFREQPRWAIHFALTEAF